MDIEEEHRQNIAKLPMWKQQLAELTPEKAFEDRKEEYRQWLARYGNADVFSKDQVADAEADLRALTPEIAYATIKHRLEYTIEKLEYTIEKSRVQA